MKDKISKILEPYYEDAYDGCVAELEALFQKQQKLTDKELEQEFIDIAEGKKPPLCEKQQLVPQPHAGLDKLTKKYGVQSPPPDAEARFEEWAKTYTDEPLHDGHFFEDDMKAAYLAGATPDAAPTEEDGDNG